MAIESTPFASETETLDYDLLGQHAALISSEHWSLLRVSGEDAKSWLQGQVTNDLRGFADGDSISFCFCNSTGQIEAVADAWAVGEVVYLTCEAAVTPAILNRAEDTVIMEDVLVEDLHDRYRLLSIQGPAAQKIVEGLALSNEVIQLRSHRTAASGLDLWMPAQAENLIGQIKAQVPNVSPSTSEVARLEAGIPRAGHDYDAKTLAAEMGESFVAAHISYTKGCYTGQEVLMRIHSRGHTNRTWMGLLCDAPVPSGAIVSHPTKSGVGKVTSTAVSPSLGPIAAAFIRNEFAHEGEGFLVETHSTPVHARAISLPFTPRKLSSEQR
jgi:folate-binding protein YgfZ